MIEKGLGKKKCSSIGWYIRRTSGIHPQWKYMRSSYIRLNWNDMRNEFGYTNVIRNLTNTHGEKNARQTAY